MIYKGKRIAKVKDWDIEKGDIGYVKDSDLPHVINNTSFLLSEVIVWEEFVGDDGMNGEYFKGNRNSKFIKVYFKYSEPFIIIETMDKFDLIMEQYSSNKMIFRPQ